MCCNIVKRKIILIIMADVFFGFLDHVIIFVLHGLYQFLNQLIDRKINFLLQV